MSDKQEVSPNPYPEVPQDVKDLQENLTNLNSFHKVVLSGTFTGAQSKTTAKLVEFLHDLYKQTLNQFEEHPYVIEMKAKMKQ